MMTSFSLPVLYCLCLRVMFEMLLLLMVLGLSSSLPPSPADSGVSVSEPLELSDDARDRRFISGEKFLCDSYYFLLTFNKLFHDIRIKISLPNCHSFATLSQISLQINELLSFPEIVEPKKFDFNGTVL